MGINFGLLQGMFRSNPDRIIWQPVAEKFASDDVSFSERVKSKIPVLPWQDGYSYYNNYSSRKPSPGGEVDLVKVDIVPFDDGYQVQKNKLVTRVDSVGVTDSPLRVEGRIFKGLWREEVGLQEEVLRRSGLWSITRTDQVLQSEASDLHGRQVRYGYDSVNERETYWNYYGIGRDSVSLIRETAEQHGIRVYKQTDTVYLYESTLRNGRRSINVQDYVFFGEFSQTHGTRAITRRDDLTVTESNAGRTGKFSKLSGDTVYWDEKALVPYGKRSWVFEEPVQINDYAIPFLRRMDEQISITETGEQHGTRVYGRSEQIAVSELLINNERVMTDGARMTENYFLKFASVTRGETVSVSDTIGIPGTTFTVDGVAAQDRWSIFRYKTTLRVDGVFVDERASRTGRWTFSLRDSVSLNDSYPPFRFSWRDNIQVSEGKLGGRVRVIEAGDQWQVADRGSNGALPVDAIEYDQASMTEVGVIHRLGQTDRVYLKESGEIHGRLSKFARDQVEEQDWQGPFYTPTPRLGDSVRVTEEALQLHGKRSFLYTEQINLQDDRNYGRRGRWVFTRGEYYIVEDNRNQPAVPGQRDTVFVGERTDTLAQRDWAVMDDRYIKEDTTQVIRVQDTGFLNTKELRIREGITAGDTGWGNTSLDYRKNIRVGENKLVEKPYHREDQVSVSEKHKLFRRSDYLEPRPDFYEERPGRTRSAVRLSLDTHGALWACWLEGPTLYYAKRVKPDSWQGHQRYQVSLPKGPARSCTLYFDGLLPVPVAEYPGELAEYRANTGWTFFPGADPVTVQTALCYLSPQRTELIVNGERIQLTTVSRIDQAFETGALVFNDIGTVTYKLGDPPARRNQLSDEVASVRWSIPVGYPEPPAYISPIEGDISFE